MGRAINAKRFSKVMRDLARVPSQAARKISEDIERDIQRQMDASKDPEDRAWKLKANGRRSRLKRSGRGRAGILVTPTRGAGFRIVVMVLYMIYHQFGGASHLRGPGGSYRKRHKNKDFGRDKDRSSGRNRPPKRSFLPFDRMPKRWLDIVQKRIEEAAQRRIDRGG